MTDINKRLQELQEEREKLLQVLNMNIGATRELKALLEPIKKPSNNKPKTSEGKEIKKEIIEKK